VKHTHDQKPFITPLLNDIRYTFETGTDLDIACAQLSLLSRMVGMEDHRLIHLEAYTDWAIQLESLIEQGHSNGYCIPSLPEDSECLQHHINRSLSNLNHTSGIADKALTENDLNPL
jgi:monomeric isocitrate dehydrogenase